MKKSWFRIFQNLHIKQKISPYHQNWAMCKVFPATTHLTWYQNPHVFCSASFSEDSFAACVEKKHCRFLTSVCWSLDCSHHMRAVLCDGLNRKLMLSQRCLLHYSNCLYGSGCRSLKDTSSCTYRGSCDGRHRFYFHWGGRDNNKVEWMVLYNANLHQMWCQNSSAAHLWPLGDPHSPVVLFCTQLGLLVCAHWL